MFQQEKLGNISSNQKLTSRWEYDTENHTEKSIHTEKIFETTLKRFTKNNHTGIFHLITLKCVSYCFSRMLIPYNPMKPFNQKRSTFNAP